MVLTEKGNNLLKSIGKAITDFFAALLIFLLFIFVLGELYAMYFARNPVILWAPIALLMLVLIAKALD